MNERIRELAEQSGANYYSLGDRFEKFDEHKFAELIVRECAKVADGGWADPGHQIKQHFGVEE